MKVATVLLVAVAILSGCTEPATQPMSPRTLQAALVQVTGCYELTLGDFSQPGQLFPPSRFQLAQERDLAQTSEVPLFLPEGNAVMPGGSWRLTPTDSLLVSYHQGPSGVTIDLVRVATKSWAGTASATSIVRYASPVTASATLQRIGCPG